MESKKYGLTGLSFLTRYGFTGQGNQIGNNLIINRMEWTWNGWREIKNPSTYSKEGTWMIMNKEKLRILYQIIRMDKLENMRN